jgi:hypothetical protein
MSQEKNGSDFKQVKTVFVGDENLPTHYVNSVNIRSGLEEFFLTFGTVVPFEITDISDLGGIESINAHPLFRCAVSRSTMKQIIDLMTSLYENQSRQLELLQAAHGKDEADVDNSSRPSQS